MEISNIQEQEGRNVLIKVEISAALPHLSAIEAFESILGYRNCTEGSSLAADRFFIFLQWRWIRIIHDPTSGATAKDADAFGSSWTL